MRATGGRRWWGPIWVVAGVVVVVGACTSPADVPVETVPEPAPVEPVEVDERQGLPPIETWRWQEIIGDPSSLPNTPPRVRIDGEFVALDHEFADSWWRSPDGISWKKEDRPADLPAAVWGLAQVGDSVWALTGDGPPLQRVKDGWEVIDLPELPDGPMGFFPEPVSHGDLILVNGWEFDGGGNFAWVSADGGETYQAVDIPWAERSSPLVGAMVTDRGLIVYGPPGEPGGIPVWSSSDGNTWTAEDRAFGGAVYDAAQVFDIGRPYLATTAAGGGIADGEQLWTSPDGITWQPRAPISERFQDYSLSFHRAGFGLVAIGFGDLPEARQTGDDQVAVGLSADGGSWIDVSDLRIHYPGEPPGNAAGSMGWSVVGDTVFVVRSFEGGQRTVWVGSFGG